MNIQSKGALRALTDLEAPPYFMRVVVPIANPKSARHMLTLACDLVDPEDGTVFALTVAEGEQTEEANERVEELEEIIAEFQAKEQPVKLVTQIASSISRGILDGAREQSAEALILGVQRSDRRQVKLGNLVENIIDAAPCNVLIYRTAESPEYDRVVVPLNSSIDDTPALITGVLLSSRRQIPIYPLYIQRDYSYRADRESGVRALLDLIPSELVHKDFVTGRRPAENILRDVDDNDLLVIGFRQRDDIELQFGRDVAETLLSRAPGPVLLSSQILEQRGTLMGTIQRQLQRFNPALTQVERNEMVWQARRSSLTGIDYIMLIVMSAGLASLGLMLNSVAVIIGAMLVAPLMSPLGALSTGMATGQIDITRRSVVTLIQGTFFAIMISFLMGTLLPVENPTSEMLSRGTPSLLDAAVAMVSGLVGGFALARKEIPVALAGVAIAAALMPPVCTIGLGLALQQPQLAAGASLLFVTNITFIVVAENIIFLWVGMRPGRRQETRRAVAAWWSVIIGLLVVVVWLIISLSQQATLDQRIETFLLDRLPQSQFFSIEVTEEDDVVDVLFNVITSELITPARVEVLEDELSTQFERAISLEIVSQSVIAPRSDNEQAITTYFTEQMGIVRVIQMDLDETEDGVLDVDAVVRVQNSITGEDVVAAEIALSEQLEQPVRLYLVIQQLVTANESVEVTPEIDDSETDETEEQNDPVETGNTGGD